MKWFYAYPLTHWSMRECFRYPRQTWVTIFCLFLVTAFPGTLLLLTHAIEKTNQKVLEKSPSLIIRRVTPLGWQPMPEDAVASLKNIPGVNKVEPRIWGLCGSDFGTLTVRVSSEILANHEVILSSDIAHDELDPMIITAHKESLTFVVKQKREPGLLNNAPACILANETVARQILGLAEGTVSDIALTFFHDEEAEYAIPEIIEALPFTVQITTKGEALKRYAADNARWGGLGMLLMLPALIAMFFFFLAQRETAKKEQRHLGIMKLMGWTTPELAWSYLIKSTLVGVPSILLGFCFSYFMIYGPYTSWIGRFFFGWVQIQPRFLFVPAWGILFELGALILVPFLVSQLLPLFLSSGKDPAYLLESGDQG